MRSRQSLFIGFAIIGVIGFVVDAGVVAILVRGLGRGAYHARLCSYFFAVTTTWWLNRRFNFRSESPPAREFAAFLLTNAFGAAINLSLYAAIIAWFGASGWIPVAAVAAGSLAGLSINFLLSSRLVFSRRRNKTADNP